MFTLMHVLVQPGKKKVKNKVHDEASICEAYIVKEISIFISYFFKPHMRTRINYVPIQEDGGELSSSGNLSIFFPYWLIIIEECNFKKYLIDIEIKQAYNYVLFNCDD